jgi:hypothetical protein
MTSNPFPGEESTEEITSGHLANLLRRTGQESRVLKRSPWILGKWWKAEKSWYDHQKATFGGFPPRPDNFFARRVIYPHPEEEAPVFKSLSSLSLSAVSFEFAESEII